MMNHSHAAKLLAVILAVAMLFSVFTFTVSAADEDKTEAAESTSISSLAELLAAVRYSVYSSRYTDVSRGTEDIVIDATDFSEADTTAKIGDGEEEVRVVTYDGKKGVFCPEDGAVGWKVTVPKEGMYSMEIEYYPVEGKSSSIERSLYIDGKVPFYEARYIAFTKVWSDTVENDEEGNPAFKSDINGNEIRPDKKQTPVWRTSAFRDETGYYVNPFEFYLSAGEHTIQLEAQREAMAIKSIRIYPYEPTISYDEYIKKYRESDYVKGETIASSNDGKASVTIEAELPEHTSEMSIYPIYDRTSPLTSPQSPSKILLNTIGGEKWEANGQWASWKITVPEAGLYKIGLRYKQDVNDGMFSSRLIRINGEIPFDEAKYLQFNYGDTWQSVYLNDGSEEHADGLYFYLEKGENTIELEATFGNMTDVITRLQNAINIISDSYIDILMITGASPDSNRDYNFYKLIPTSIDNLYDMAVELNEIADIMIETSGKSANASTLQTVARTLEKMGTKEDEVAKNMGSLKTNIGTLGTWLQTAMTQPLELDVISVCGADAGSKQLPKAEASPIQSVWYEISQFAISFVSDYNTLGATQEIDEDHAVVAWTSSGRDQAQIIRNLINNNFTNKYGVAVSLKLVAAGSLLPSILAGVGPDVALDGAEVINWAIRDAILPLDELDGFDEIVSEFPDAALIPLTLFTDNIENYNRETDGPITDDQITAHIYGLPVTMTFNMMFYRADIFQSMGLQVPKTWDDFYALIPILQNNQMDVAFPQDLNMFLYQSLPSGASVRDGLYADNGRRINLDSNLALSAFDKMCSLFTQYSLPLAYDFINRFRTGEMPIGIISYAQYTQLNVFAPEIKGLWEFVPLPGTVVEKEDGTTEINNNAVATVTSIVMPRGDRSEEKKTSAWEFMKWYVGHENQSNYANEYAALLGSGTKYETANAEALAELPWSTSEYKNIMEQFNHLSGVPDYPGSYIIARYTNFAFMNVYNNHADPVESMLDYITDINKEISRKRKEFNLDAYEIDYSTTFTESEKR